MRFRDMRFVPAQVRNLTWPRAARQIRLEWRAAATLCVPLLASTVDCVSGLRNSYNYIYALSMA